MSDQPPKKIKQIYSSHHNVSLESLQQAYLMANKDEGQLDALIEWKDTLGETLKKSNL